MIIEEMTTWTADEALVQVHVSLPKGWRFQTTTVDRFTTAYIYDADGVEQWQSEEPHPDLRFVYLEAYGWLNTRTASIRHPAWNRRREINSQVVADRFGIKVDVPDPEELDPEMIADRVRKEFG